MNGSFARNLSGIDGQYCVADRELNQLPIFSCSPLVQANYLYPSNAYVFASDDCCARHLRELACTREGGLTSASSVESSSGQGLAFVSQVPVHIRLVPEIHRWPRGLPSLVQASTRRYSFTVLAIDRLTGPGAMLT